MKVVVKMHVRVVDGVSKPERDMSFMTRVGKIYVASESCIGLNRMCLAILAG